MGTGVTSSDPYQLLRDIAGMLLDERVPELTERAVTRLRSDEPAYATSQVSLDDLTGMMGRTLALALTRLSGRPIPPDIAIAASEAGRLRAQQGLPLAVLLHAFRIDLRIIWEAIIQEVQGRDSASASAFVESSVLVWDAIEANTTEVVDAYRETQRDLAQRLDEVQRDAFDLLIDQGERNSKVVRESGARLNLPLDGPYLALVSGRVAHRQRTALLSGSRLRQRGLGAYASWSGGEFCMLIALADRSPDEVISMMPELSEARVAGALGAGLASAPRMVRLARRVAAGMTEDGVRLLQSSWIETIVHADEELAEALGRSVLGPLLDLPGPDRQAILEVVEAYIGGSGSVGEVATNLFRHRNTVRYRLQAAERLSGLDLSRPRDLAAMALALAWLRGPGGPELDAGAATSP
jgi:PucR C-terminal helix-turn-helix domain